MASTAAQVAYWIVERENIRAVKEAGKKPPWTDDRILGTYRFCNVHRENDAVTRWIAKHWRNPHGDDPNIARAMTLARLINWPPTLAAIGYPTTWDMDHIVGTLRDCELKGKAWSSAYIVSTNGRKMEKALYVVRDVAGRVPRITASTLAEAHKQLMQVNGLGSFMAGQIVADLKNTPGHPLRKAPDWWNWAAPGPGSIRGLRRYFTGRKLPYKDFLSTLEVVAYEVGQLIPDGIVEAICAQNWQNILCEVDKWWRAHYGEGRPKSYYRSNAHYTQDFPDGRVTALLAQPDGEWKVEVFASADHAIMFATDHGYELRIPNADNTC